jgi:hypothetical protein
MHLTFSPMRRDDRLSLSCAGDVLTINGIPYDFGPLPDGATLPQEAVDCDWLAGPVERVDGVLHVALILPHGANAPEATLFPQPITAATDGPVTLMAYEVSE